MLLDIICTRKHDNQSTINQGESEESAETITNYHQPDSTENVEQVGEMQTQPPSKTYEDLFMENVKKFGPRRQRRIQKGLMMTLVHQLTALHRKLMNRME